LAVKKNKSKSLRSANASCSPVKCKECKAECRDRKDGADKKEKTSDKGNSDE
jgi:hypothetical protein